MPAKSVSQARLFGMAHAYQTGELRHASPEVRRIAESVSKQDVLDFAHTKHRGLPDHVKEAGKGFFHLMRSVQRGEKSIGSVSESVASAAKRHIPKDATETKDAGDSNVTFTPTPAANPTIECASKLSHVQTLGLVQLFQKQADIHSILSKSHQAIEGVSAARRDTLKQEVERLRSHNEKLQKENMDAKSKIMVSEEKAHKSEIQAAQSNLTVEQMQALQQQQRNPPPPEQPPYGAQLLGGAPGQPVGQVGQPQPGAAA